MAGCYPTVVEWSRKSFESQVAWQPPQMSTPHVPISRMRGDEKILLVLDALRQ